MIVCADVPQHIGTLFIYIIPYRENTIFNIRIRNILVLHCNIYKLRRHNWDIRHFSYARA